jgi:hypothetical protein
VGLFGSRRCAGGGAAHMRYDPQPSL